MTLAATRTRVAEIICEHLDVEPSSVGDDVLLIETLGADSLDMIELCLAFEDAFQINIGNKETFYTPAEATALIARKLGVTE